MVVTHAEFEIDDNVTRTDFTQVHAWLTTAYWSEGISRDKVERGAAHSALVVGAFASETGAQAGYMRVVSDTTRFAYICDVFVDPAYRGRGLAREMVRFALQHPNFTEVSRWILATRDAHTVYAGVGFGPLPEPGRWMIYLPGEGGTTDCSSAPTAEARVG